MTGLYEMKCVACRAGVPTLTEDEIARYLPEVPEWRVKPVDGVNRLERSYKFPDFSQAVAFTNRVADLAEFEGHHPLIITEWGRVTIRWWTHKIHGLHRNDFIMAAKTDRLAGA